MQKILTLAALAALALPAAAMSTDSVLMPPPRYANDGRCHIRRVYAVSHAALQEACAGAEGSYTQACTLFVAGRPVLMVLPRGVSARTLHRLEAHECAHVLGWPADHPGGHW
jgi:hypothetical protein